jgi:magnesium chelatase subunit I
VSQRLPISCLENVVSNAERRTIVSGDAVASARIADIYAAIPAITGKIELEYEGELKGAEAIARDLIKQSVLPSFRQAFPGSDFKNVIEYFELGGTLKVADTDSTASVLAQLQRVPTLMDHVTESAEGARVAVAEFILEGLYASDKIGRSEERGFVGVERRAAAQDLYRDYTMERNRNKKPLN